jgi:hypothetical protein
MATQSKTFTGNSNREDFTEALGDAIKQAEESSNIADFQFTWTVDKISGKHGGIAGLKRLSVTIKTSD